MDRVYLSVHHQYVIGLINQINSLLGIQERMIEDLKKADERIKELEEKIKK